MLMLQEKLVHASRFRGPLDGLKWGSLATAVYEALKRVDKSIGLDHQSMTRFRDRLGAEDRHRRVEADIKEIKEDQREGTRQWEEIAVDIKEIKEGNREIGAGIKKALDRLDLLKFQIDDVLKELNAVRIDQAEGTCPRGFFLVPADKTQWSLAKTIDCFSLYTTKVELFFVCRMFFEELKEAAAKSEADRDAMVAGRSNTQFEHEFSEPIALELPREVVAERLHAIRLSVKIVQLLVNAASLPLPLSLGNVIPGLDGKEQDELVGVLQHHLASAEKDAASGPPPEDVNFLKSSKRRFKLCFKCLKKPTTPGNARSPAEAHRALQGYLDTNHPGVWQAKVHDKLVATANLDKTDHAYICKAVTHMDNWIGKPTSTPIR